MDLFDHLLAPAIEESRFFGVAIAVVTNNKDPDKLARVKVKFPWLSEQEESGWARIASPMAGNGRGFYVLPEVNDEVLVAFEHGLIDHPYVLGALWNGKDEPPENNDDGKNNRRIIKSRAGHIIRLDDTEHAEKIEIVAKGGKDTITIDAKANSITISSDKDLTIESKNGAVKLRGQTVEIVSTSGAIKVDSKAALELKAAGALKQNGATAELKSNGQMTIKGAVVNIN
jgi:uncharacterized protein involved in type VI secretion and phage assembly